MNYESHLKLMNKKALTAKNTLQRWVLKKSPSPSYPSAMDLMSEQSNQPRH
ncbi:hypothetical protein [Liquorilactobacillus hordei]|uniref:hypothetical protein n=1 Tax=Liquorilactobacillus hordei TaxID=468911 RepID=UPI0039EC925F